MAGSPVPRAAFANERVRDGLVCLAIFLFVVAAKLPGILCPIELGLDESQLLVQAMRYQHDLMPWRAVDGTTSGPLNSWLPLAASYVGIPLNYHGAHLLGALLSAAIVAGTFLALRVAVGFWVAGLVAAVGVVTLAGAVTWDFMQLTTEQFPAALLAVAAWLWLRETKRERPRLPGLMLAAALVGLVPWAKLQGLPIGAAFGVVMLWQLWSGHGHPDQARRIRSLLLVAGAAVAPTVLILGPVVAAGAGQDFWQSYLVAALGYAGDVSLGLRLERAWSLASESTLRVVLGLIVFAVLPLLWCRIRLPRRPDAAERSLLLFGALGSIAALFACLKPATHFAHYQFWLIGPPLLLGGALLHHSGQALAGWTGWRRLAIGGVTLVVIAHLAPDVPRWRGSRELLAEFTRDAATSPQRLFAGALRDRAPAARTMMVWGWMPSLYLESGLTCVTRHAIGHFLIDPVPSRDFLRRSYLADLRQNQPDVFVDAIASGCFLWYWDVKTSGMESFPELAAYVNEHYRLVAKPTMDPAGTPLRIFVRKSP